MEWHNLVEELTLRHFRILNWCILKEGLTSYFLNNISNVEDCSNTNWSSFLIDEKSNFP